MKYIGVYSVDAEPMNLGEYNTFRGWTIPADEDTTKEGYKIENDGYTSWRPKEVFEKQFLPLTDPEGNKIVEADVANFVKSKEASIWRDKTTVLHVTLKNGFIMTEASSCVDPANYNGEIGINICLERIQNKVWELLGFLLQCAKNGVK
jgi:hypothetical protein